MLKSLIKKIAYPALTKSEGEENMIYPWGIFGRGRIVDEDRRERIFRWKKIDLILTPFLLLIALFLWQTPWFYLPVLALFLLPAFLSLWVTCRCPAAKDKPRLHLSLAPHAHLIPLPALLAGGMAAFVMFLLGLFLMISDFKVTHALGVLFFGVAFLAIALMIIAKMSRSTGSD